MQEYARVCEQAARAAGDILKGMRGDIQAREKAPADLVTEADLAAQAAIRKLVLDAFPDHGFLGEETLPSVVDTCHSAEFLWIVDPLDGTTNYVHGLEHFCVSVALRRGDRLIVATVFDPMRDECFTARAGAGAFCNGRPIRCSQTVLLEQALVAASLPPRVTPNSPEVTRFLNMLYRCQAVRRMGSAALNLSYLAAGRLDGYWATSVKQWDVAAGWLLVQEAGGVITGIDGDAIQLERPRFVASGNPVLHAELLTTLRLP